MNPRYVPAIGLIALASLGGVASADVVEIASSSSASTENLGAFAGTLSFTPTGATTGTLGVSLTNTTAFAGGKITGFVFRIPSADPSAMAALSSASTHPLFQDTGAGSAPPFGMFDGGAALGGDWTGGGSPNGGIAIDATGFFEFTISASDAGGMSAAGFVSEDSPYEFIVRMRGFDNGGSDKVPAVLVPAPGAGMLLLMGGLGAGGVGRRRRCW